MTIPGMSVSGRGFTSYVSSAIMNNDIKSRYDINDNTEYREFIHLNGTAISQELNQKAEKNVMHSQWWR